MKMLKVFLDANVFFAAASSPSGGSSLIIELAAKQKIKPFTVAHVLKEAERNILKKLDDNAIQRHYENLINSSPVIQPLGHISLHTINSFRGVVPDKDIPVLIGAVMSNPDYLITLDKKHFLKNAKLVAIPFQFKIVNPGDFLKDFIKQNSYV